MRPPSAAGSERSLASSDALRRGYRPTSAARAAPMRPPSAAGSERSITSSEASRRRRPISAWTREVTPPQRPSNQAIDDWFRSFSDRDQLQMSIEGTLGGAAMTGVQNYPYSMSQRLYHEDVRKPRRRTPTAPKLNSSSLSLRPAHATS
jgi:hypothetical protein